MPEERNETEAGPLSPIIGERLHSVVFVHDYVQLHFGEAGITAVTVPSVKVGGITSRWGVFGYCDLLCGRIGKTVRVASVVEGAEVRIEFDDGSVISISLKPEDYRAAEAVIFNHGAEDTWVW